MSGPHPAGRGSEPDRERLLELTRRLRSVVRELGIVVRQLRRLDGPTLEPNDAASIPAEAETGAVKRAAERPAGVRESGERAIMNTLYRSGGEVIGRLSSLVLFAAAGRILGANGLGAFVIAVAYMGFVMTGVNLGLDRYLLRVAARDRTAADRLFFNALALKLALAVPLFAAGYVVLQLLGYNHQVQATTWALAPGVFADSVARTQLSVFLARERGGPPSLADSLQRIVSAGLGIGALRAGYGVVSVSVTYSAGSIFGVVLGFILLKRTIGVPAFNVTAREWRGLVRGSLPFATQETVGLLVARITTLILAALATQAAVGLFGAAFRLFESSLLVTYAVAGAFAAMFSYLGRDTVPPLRAVFARSLKLSLVLLTPVAVVFGLLAEPICRVIYGVGLAAAGEPLRILAPAVVLMAVVTLANTLMLSRENPGRMVLLAAVMGVVNIALNFALIPPFSDAGAAVGIVVTQAIYAVWILRVATRAVGPVRWLQTVAGASAGAACMTLVTLTLGGLWISLIVGTAVYLVALFAVERLVSSGDVAIVVGMLRRLAPARLAR